jgi:hypothetical protein
MKVIYKLILPFLLVISMVGSWEMWEKIAKNEFGPII